MNEQLYNHQSLNAYLLGTLPEVEMERFDELSFTDDEFADALEAAEKDLVDAYAQNELTGATLTRFETHYLASPRRREKVEFAEAWQIFAAQNLPEKSAADIRAKRTINGFFFNFLIVSRPARQWSFALAALAFLIVGGWLWRENSRLRFEVSRTDANREQPAERETELAEREKQLPDESADQPSANSETERELAQIREERVQLEEQSKQAQAQQRLVEQQKLDEQQRATRRGTPNAPQIAASRAVIASFVLAPSLRGGGKIQTVLIPSRSAGISAALELEADEYSTYRAVLRNASGEQTLWQSGKLKSKSVGGNARLNVNFPAKLLPVGVYSIELVGIAADGAAEIISDYSFRVVR